MKLLIVCDYFYPAYKSGGPIRTIVNLIENMPESTDIKVYTKDREISDVKPFSIVKEDEWQRYNLNTLVKYINFKKITLFKIKKDLDENYDVIYLNSFFSKLNLMVLLLIKLKLLKVKKVVLAPRGELMLEALKNKEKRKLPMIRLYKIMNIQKNINFHVTSEFEADSVKRYFPHNEISVIPNIGKSFQKPERKHVKNKNELKVVLVGRVSRIKNIEYSINLISKMSNKKNVRLDIFGKTSDEEYYNELLVEIDKLSLKGNINFKGTLNPIELNENLRQYDLFLSNTLSENYGHAIVEAISNSVPILISNTTPWLNLETAKIGADYDLTEENKFVMFLEKVYGMSDVEYKSEFSGFKQFHDENISSHKFINRYKELLTKTT